MKRFQYTARVGDRFVTAEIEAVDVRAARGEMHRNGLLPITLEEISPVKIAFVRFQENIKTIIKDQQSKQQEAGDRGSILKDAQKAIRKAFENRKAAAIAYKAIDPETGDWLLFLFDSYGFPPLQPARGRWEGNRLVLEKTTPRGVGRTVFEIGPDRFTYSVASSAHGAATFTPVMDGVYRRS